MKTKLFILTVLSIIFSISAQTTPSQSISQTDSRTSLNLTIYNNNRALVQEKRKISLEKGISNIRFEGVAQLIIPQSLIVTSNGNGFSVLEQNYEFDLISREKLLEKYIGKEVTLIDENQLLSKEKRVKAKITANSFSPVFEVDGKILLGFDGKILLPELPENLYAKPTLNWLVHTEKSGEATADVSYLTEGLNWNADYVMLLADDDKSAAITAWVTLTNQSGAAFENAKLQLVAGDVNMVQQQEQHQNIRISKAMAYGSAMMDAAPRIEEKSFDEYHLYSVANPVSVNENQTKQIEMFAAENIKTQKRYRVKSGGSYIPLRSNNEKGNPLTVQSEIVFETGKKNNLDLPFPKGVIRIYKKDGQNNVFIGEDNVKHTPINEEIALKSGDAFDITCFEKKTNEKKINDNKSEYSKEITFSNHKKESVSVWFEENLWGNWAIKSDMKYSKINANTAKFEVNIPAGKTIVLKYAATIER